MREHPLTRFSDWVGDLLEPYVMFVFTIMSILAVFGISLGIVFGLYFVGCYATGWC